MGNEIALRTVIETGQVQDPWMIENLIRNAMHRAKFENNPNTSDELRRLYLEYKLGDMVKAKFVRGKKYNVMFQEGSKTIRQQPENYLLVIQNEEGEFYANPDKASTLNAHSLTLCIGRWKEFGEGKDGHSLAKFIDENFWG